MVQKIYIRRGLQAELDNIILEEAEPGWTTDTKMMYMGDGTTSGGLLVTASGLGITSLQGLMGEVTISGRGKVDVSTEGQVIVVSGTINDYVQSVNSLTDDIVISGVGSVTVSSEDDKIVISGEEFPRNFIELEDSPSDYTGHSDKLVTVNEAADGLEFSKTLMVQSSLSNNDYSGLVASGIAGETLSFGDHIILNNSSKWIKTNATEENRTDGHIGIAVVSGVVDSNISLLLTGYIRNNLWTFGIGNAVYISTTSGELTASEPTEPEEFVRRVGHASSETVLWYNPDNTFIKLKV